MAQSNGEQVNLGVEKSNVLFFSDGADEVVEEVSVTQNESTQRMADNVDPTSLSWGPWISYYATRSGTKMLNAVDYAGEGLANFFGITTPKYQLEIYEYERMLEEKKKLDDESAGWVPKNTGGDVPLVLNEPTKVYEINSTTTTTITVRDTGTEVE